MELQLPLRDWMRRTPDWTAAVVAGLVAGAVLMVLDLLWPLMYGDGNPWATSHKIAALLLGQQVLQSSGFELGVVAAALLIHYTLGIFSGLVIGVAIAGLGRGAGLVMTQVIGYTFGVVVYIVNFYVLASLFPWFQEMRGEATFLGQLAFGVSAALIYRKLSLSRASTTT